MDKVFYDLISFSNKIICAISFLFYSFITIFLIVYKIQRPRIYLLGRPDCLRGFTKIGKVITPTVKRQIGATTINIDSRDINNFEFINK